MNYKNVYKILILIAIIAIGTSSVSAGFFDGDSGGAALKESGEYKVGTDIPAGEYYIKCDGSNLYVEIASDSSGSIESIVGNLNTVGGVYVTVHDGEYLKVEGGKIYELSNKPEVEEDNGYLPEGQYKVGTDIPAGEYTLEATSDYGYVEVTSDSRHDILNSIVTNDNFENNKIITVSEGQYIMFNDAKLKV